MRYVMTRVLPLPAPAKTSRGPFAWATAAACGSFSSSSGIERSENLSVPSGRVYRGNDSCIVALP